MKGKLQEITVDERVAVSGDPKKWAAGLYDRTQGGGNMVLVVKDATHGTSVLYITGQRVYTPVGGLYDGYVKLPSGSVLEITV